MQAEQRRGEPPAIYAVGRRRPELERHLRQRHLSLTGRRPHRLMSLRLRPEPPRDRRVPMPGGRACTSGPGARARARRPLRPARLSLPSSPLRSSRKPKSLQAAARETTLAGGLNSTRGSSLAFDGAGRSSASEASVSSDSMPRSKGANGGGAILASLPGGIDSISRAPLLSPAPNSVIVSLPIDRYARLRRGCRQTPEVDAKQTGECSDALAQDRVVVGRTVCASVDQHALAPAQPAGQVVQRVTADAVSQQQAAHGDRAPPMPITGRPSMHWCEAQTRAGSRTG